MTFSVQLFLKKLPLPFVYAASGWVITEIPVVINFVPSTIDGHSTAMLVSGLAFMLSGAMWVHKELAPYMTPSQITTTAVSQTPTTSAATFKIGAPATAKVGSNFSIFVSGGAPNTTFTLYESGQPQDSSGAISAEHPLDSKGNGQIDFEPLNRLSPIGALLSSQGSISFYAVDGKGNKTSAMTIRLG